MRLTQIKTHDKKKQVITVKSDEKTPKTKRHIVNKRKMSSSGKKNDDGQLPKLHITAVKQLLIWFISASLVVEVIPVEISINSQLERRML